MEKLENTTKNKKNFAVLIKKFLTNKTVICCFLLTLIYLASGFNRWVEIGVPVVAFFAFLFLPVKQGFCLFVYLHCYGLSNLGWYSCLMATVFCYTLALIIKYIIGLTKKRYKFYCEIFFIMLGLIAFGSLISFLHKPIYMGALAYLAYLPLIYCVFAMRKEFDIHLAINYLFVGLVVSSVLALALFKIPHYQYHPFWGNRFCSFTNCPNYYYMRVFVVLTYYMFLAISNKLGILKFSLIYLICATMILSTISKTAICLLALFSLIFIVAYTCQNFKKRIKYVALFALVLLVVLGISYRPILDVFKRFSDVENGNFLNALTTGRSEIWLAYLKKWAETPATILFGQGMFGPKLFIQAINHSYDTHSFVVMLIYRFGLVGIVALCAIAILMIKELNCSRPKFAAWLPFIWFLIESLTDNTFQVNNIFMLILVCQILFCNCKTKPQQTK